MTGLVAVVKKDYKSFFLSQFAYIVFGVYAFFMGFYYSILLFAYMKSHGGPGLGQPPMTLEVVTTSLLHANSYIITFLMPIITMRMFAEEKRQQTFELLFTSPISLMELVVAKFVSVFGLLMVLVSILAIYFGLLFAWGNPELNVVLSGILGTILLMATYTAMGGFISAFCSSQAIAAILGYVLLLFLYLLPAVGQFIYAKIGGVEVGPLLSYLTPQGHFKPFVDGVVYAKHVWFYLSVTALFLFMTMKVVESNRWR